MNHFSFSIATRPRSPSLGVFRAGDKPLEMRDLASLVGTRKRQAGFPGHTGHNRTLITSSFPGCLEDVDDPFGSAAREARELGR